jgi:hypothetical protein
MQQLFYARSVLYKDKRMKNNEMSGPFYLGPVRKQNLGVERGNKRKLNFKNKILSKTTDPRRIKIANTIVGLTFSVDPFSLSHRFSPLPLATLPLTKKHISENDSVPVAPQIHSLFEQTLFGKSLPPLCRKK